MDPTVPFQVKITYLDDYNRCLPSNSASSSAEEREIPSPKRKLSSLIEMVDDTQKPGPYRDIDVEVNIIPGLIAELKATNRPKSQTVEKISSVQQHIPAITLTPDERTEKKQRRAIKKTPSLPKIDKIEFNAHRISPRRKKASQDNPKSSS